MFEEVLSEFPRVAVYVGGFLRPPSRPRNVRALLVHGGRHSRGKGYDCILILIIERFEDVASHVVPHQVGIELIVAEIDIPTLCEYNSNKNDRYRSRSVPRDTMSEFGSVVLASMLSSKWYELPLTCHWARNRPQERWSAGT